MDRRNSRMAGYQDGQVLLLPTIIAGRQKLVTHVQVEQFQKFLIEFATGQRKGLFYTAKKIVTILALSCYLICQSHVKVFV